MISLWNEFCSRMKFVPHSHVKIDRLCLTWFKFPRISFVRVLHKTLCILMAIAATISNNLTTGLLLWARRKRQSHMLALSPNSGLLYANIFTKRREERRRRSHWIRPGRTDLWWRNMIKGLCFPEEWKKTFE